MVQRNIRASDSQRGAGRYFMVQRRKIRLGSARYGLPRQAGGRKIKYGAARRPSAARPRCTDTGANFHSPLRLTSNLHSTESEPDYIFFANSASIPNIPGTAIAKTQVQQAVFL
jgi:hypothetical protein